jgi:hypothetical protein
VVTSFENEWFDERLDIGHYFFNQMQMTKTISEFMYVFMKSEIVGKSPSCNFTKVVILTYLIALSPV